jgi:hypothetical protein
MLRGFIAGATWKYPRAGILSLALALPFAGQLHPAPIHEFHTFETVQRI